MPRTVSYRPPSRPPRGEWAKHLHRVRRERDLSQQQAFELVQERLHISPKSRTVYYAIDMGDRQPKPSEAEVLAAEFGWPEEAPEAPAVSAGDQAALVDAIRDLVEELRLARHEQAAWNKGVQDVLAALAAQGLTQPTNDHEPERHAGAPR